MFQVFKVESETRFFLRLLLKIKMNSSAFGPNGWRFMFLVAAGYDLNDTPKQTKDLYYKRFFESIGEVLPCRYCRDSYGPFYKSLDIDRYLKLPKCGLVRFVYDLKQLVNNKLWSQENKALREEYINLNKIMSQDDPRFWNIMREKAQKICYTKPPPSFDDLVAELEKNRAGCSAHMKTCRAPFNIEYPKLTVPNIPDPNISGKLDKDTYSGGKRKTTSRRSTKRPSQKKVTSRSKRKSSQTRTRSRKR
jgi:hypothetical protein